MDLEFGKKIIEDFKDVNTQANNFMRILICGNYKDKTDLAII